jgi:hypothetical protein
VYRVTVPGRHARCNRIAHHEPILGWNLHRHHAEILDLIEWLSPPASIWCRQNNRFPHVYQDKRIALLRLA